MFEGWSDEKLQHYDVDPETYDYTDISSRPAILLANYCTQRTPYLTVIHIWDKMSDYLLSSRHSPLDIGRGEVGLTDTNSITRTSTPSGKERIPPPPKGLDDVIKSVIDLYNEVNGKSKAYMPAEDLAVENQPLSSLFGLIEEHKLHLAFLKDNNMCGEGRKE